MFPENLRQDLVTFLPPSILPEVKCFVFYDNHPKGDRPIDILVCTQRREVIEFYKREQISSVLLNTSQNFREVRSFRNVKCDLFYIVATDDELFILSSKKNLLLEHTQTEVDSYEVYDPGSSGSASLKVLPKDDALPLFFDDNFKSLSERNTDVDTVPLDDSAPIIMQLSRKLKEVEYNVKCNENKYNEYINLRKLATFYSYQKIAPYLNESLFKVNSKQIAASMNLKAWSPWIKLCNKKIVITFNLLNNDNVLLEDVNVLLNSTAKNSLNYITKFYHKIQTKWVEIDDPNIKKNAIVTVVTCIDVKELQNDVCSGLEFDMVLALKKSGTNSLIPFEKITISASDVMGKEFDVLANTDTDEEKTFLSILATSEKITLLLRHIKDQGDSNIELTDIFSKYLKMEQLKSMQNVFVHKSSPYHILHGVMVILQTEQDNDKLIVEVHTRCPSQAVALIHYINDVVPFRIIIVTLNYKITANTEVLDNYNDEISLEIEKGTDYTPYGASALNQTSILLQYLDDCMIKMNDSKNRAILNKVGSEIDIFACGLQKFTEFRDKILNEMSSGIKECEENKSIPTSQSTVITITDDDSDHEMQSPEKSRISFDYS